MSLLERKVGDLRLDDFRTPFQPLTLVRRMLLFPSALGLQVGVAGVPSTDFLFRLFTDHQSHQAWVRCALGNQFKNFENYVRQRNEPSLTTRTSIAQRAGLDLNSLAFLVHGNKDGPLLPMVLAMIEMAEGVPLLLYTAVVAKGVFCPHCGANILDDKDIWWGKQALLLSRPAYDFVERLMGVLVVTYCAHSSLSKIEGNDAMDRLIDLVDPRRHPIGNWLNAVKHANEVSSYRDLVMDRPFEESRIRKWASGSDLMPIAAARRLIDGNKSYKQLEADLFAARALAFVTDMVMATANGPGEKVARQDAQTVVHERLKRIRANVRAAARTDRHTGS